MIAAIFIALGVLALCGFALMFINFIERPLDNDSGTLGSFGRMGQEYHPKWPPENKG
jgi:hypothetical protein